MLVTPFSITTDFIDERFEYQGKLLEEYKCVISPLPLMVSVPPLSSDQVRLSPQVPEAT